LRGSLFIMSSTSGSTGKTQLFVRKGATVQQWNFKQKFSGEVVGNLKAILATKVTVGDSAVPNYKHLVMRVISESERKKNAIIMERVDVEEGVKFDENLRTIWPEKYAKISLRAFLTDPETMDSAKQFNDAVRNPKIVRDLEKRCGYSVSDIMFEPMEAPVTGKHKVTYIHDAAYYSPIVNILANRDVGDKVIMAGWFGFGVGEYFGELTVKKTDFVDRYGRECLEWSIKGEGKSKFHPIWDPKTGYHKEAVVPVLNSEDDDDIIRDCLPVGKEVCYTLDRFYPGAGVMSGATQMFGTFIAKVISEEEYESSRSRAGNFDLDEAMKSSAAKLRAKISASKEDSSSVSGDSFVSHTNSEIDDIEREVKMPKQSSKRAPWGDEQIAALVDVDYKDPRVTASRVNSLIIQEYPGITISDKSERFEKIMALICVEMFKRKAYRDGLTEAVLRQWEAYSHPSSNPAQGMFTRFGAWAHTTAKGVCDKVTEAGSSAKSYATEKVSKSKAKATQGSWVGAVMPILALLAMCVGMCAFLIMVCLIMAKMYRGTVRTAKWSAFILSAIGGLTALGDAPPGDFVAKAKEAMAGVGAMSGAVLGAAARAAN